MTEAPSRLARLEPARVCIIKPSSLGDVVHALPILAALRRAGLRLIWRGSSTGRFARCSRGILPSMS